jgi:AAT family amino acid transporter
MAKEKLIGPNTKIEIEHENLGKGLKSRHIQMIAIGGAIGVGLFYGSAGAISFAGPAALLAYALVGFVMFFIARAAGEMSTAEPVAGAYVSYGSRYIHPFVGFMLSWSGLIGTAVGAAAEYNALGKYVQYWFPNFPIWESALICVVFITVINLIAVSLYGEIEYWLSMVKVATIVLMIILGLAMILFGIGNGGTSIGFHNLGAHGGFFAGGFKGFMFSLVLVCFAFGGVESVSITAGEAVNAKKDIPKAVNNVFFRILIFYVGAILVMLCLQPWDKIGSSGSPFVSVFSAVGIPAAAGIINFVVITAAMSAMNSGIYGGSRTTYNLGLQGNAPKVFTKVSKRNVPYAAIITVVVFQMLGVLVNAIIPASAFEIFSSGVVTLLIEIWLVILFAQLNFRKAKMKSGEDKNLTFKMPWWPYSSYFAIAFLLMILVIMGFLSFTRIALIAAPTIIFILWIAYMIMNKVRNRSLVPNAPDDSINVDLD